MNTLISKATLPLWFAVGGAALKVALIVGWRFSKSVLLFQLIADFDPVSLWFAESIVGVLFDQRRIMPGQLESFAFEAFLVLGFLFQCLAIGFLIRWVLRRFENSSQARKSR